MKRLVLLALCFGATGALAEPESPLPVPEGFEYIEGTTAPPFYLNTQSVRLNTDATQNTTFAQVMGFIEDDAGNKGYAIHQFFAQCGTGRLGRTSTRYFKANQEFVSENKAPASRIVVQGTNDAFIHAALCDKWDEE